jgi:hypothetical protein
MPVAIAPHKKVKDVNAYIKNKCEYSSRGLVLPKRKEVTIRDEGGWVRGRADVVRLRR